MRDEFRYNLTRWIIFILVALALSIPQFIKFGLPWSTTARVVHNIYDKIESLPEGSPVIISSSFDPASAGELKPMELAFVRQCFRKNLRVIGLTIWGVPAVPMMTDIINQVAKEMGKQYGVDYVILPFKPGPVYLTMCQDFYLAYPSDHKDEPTKPMPVFKGIRTLKDIKFLMDFAAGVTIDYWITYGREKAKIDLGLGCTAVMATDYYPYLQSKQLLGLIGGLGAASQYEALVQKPGTATEGMRPQTVVHLLIIALIMVGNLIFIVTKSKRR